MLPSVLDSHCLSVQCPGFHAGSVWLTLSLGKSSQKRSLACSQGDMNAQQWDYVVMQKFLYT